MPGLTFARHDFLVRISARNGEAIALTLDWGGKQATGQLFTVDAPLALSDQPSMDPLPGLFSSLDIAREFEAFRQSVQPTNAGNLNRITLQVDDARLAGVAWETFLRREAVTKPNIVDIPIVRVSPARPRVAQIPFTFPLRFLQLGWSPIKVEQCVTLAFRGIDLTTLPQTVQFHAADSSVDSFGAASFDLPDGWKTADVVHLGPDIAMPKPDVDVLHTANPEAEGTLGWLLRATDIWRARLVVMEASDAAS